MNFVGKLIEVEKIILKKVTETQYDKHLMFSFICVSYLQILICVYNME